MDCIPALHLALLEATDSLGRELRTGFGGNATGGKDGCLYHVTTLADDGAGSLREGLEQEEPLWIVFEVDGEIVLESNIHPRSNKTIDGRGFEDRGGNVTIRNCGLTINGERNLVIENIAFAGRPSCPVLEDGEDADAITIKGGSEDIWIDHCEFSDYSDGLIDVIEGSRNITISWSKFSVQNMVMLFGKSIDDVEDEIMRVTLHHNWFYQTEQYHPRIRFGKVHMYNNLLDEWGSYGAAASHRSELYSEQNIYFAPGDSKRAITIMPSADPPEGEETGSVWSAFDRFENCEPPTRESDFCGQVQHSGVFAPKDYYDYVAQPAESTGSLHNDILQGAGLCDPSYWCPAR